jgi:hypothetical protein
MIETCEHFSRLYFGKVSASWPKSAHDLVNDRVFLRFKDILEKESGCDVCGIAADYICLNVSVHISPLIT